MVYTHVSSDVENLQKMSNAAIKKARMAAVLPKELDEILSLLNARLKLLEKRSQHE